MTPMAIGLLDPAIVHRMHAGEGKAEIRTRLENAFEHMGRKFGRDIELPAQFADIGDAARSDPGIADLHLLRCSKGKGFVGEIHARELLQERPAMGAHQCEHRQARSDIRRDAMRIIRRIRREPGEIASLRHRTRDDHEFVGGEAGDGEIGLDAPPLIAPLRIDDAVLINIDVIGRDLVQHLHRVLALDEIFGKTRLVEEGDLGLERLRFHIGIGPPVLPAVGVFISWLDAPRRIPIGPFPAIDLAHAGAQRDLFVVDGRTPGAAGCLDLAIGPMHSIEKPQALDCAVMHILAHRLERMDAADIDAVHIHRRVAVLDPLRKDETGTAR